MAEDKRQDKVKEDRRSYTKQKIPERITVEESLL